MNRLLRLGIGVILAVMIVGCATESGPDREELGLGSAEEGYAQQVRGDIESLATALRDEGVAGVGSEVMNIVEDYEETESAAVGENRATYDQIFQGFSDLQQQVDSSASAGDIKAKIDELQKLADGLPGASGE